MARPTLVVLFLLATLVHRNRAFLPNGVNPFYYGLEQLTKIPNYEDILTRGLSRLMHEDTTERAVEEIVGIGDVFDDGGPACRACEVSAHKEEMCGIVPVVPYRPLLFIYCNTIIVVIDVDSRPSPYCSTHERSIFIDIHGYMDTDYSCNLLFWWIQFSCIVY